MKNTKHVKLSALLLNFAGIRRNLAGIDKINQNQFEKNQLIYRMLPETGKGSVNMGPRRETFLVFEGEPEFAASTTWP